MQTRTLGLDRAAFATWQALDADTKGWLQAFSNGVNFWLQTQPLPPEYGALIVTNIFGWRSTDPKGLLLCEDPIGRGNDAAIVRAAKEAKLVVCAWGEHGAHMERGREVLAMLAKQKAKLHFLRLNASGHPAHPLYLPSSLMPTELRP